MAKTPKTPDPQTPQDPQQEQAPAPDVLPETTSQRTYTQDDGNGPLPEGIVQHPEPVTYLADHVPDGAAPLLTTKVVRAKPAERAPTSPADVETA